MFDKYSFKEPENTNKLANQITKKSMETNPELDQHRKKKYSKIIKNTQKSIKITPRKASGPCQGSRRAKIALKEVGSKNLGVPWDPLGDPKITKKSKK